MANRALALFLALSLSLAAGEPGSRATYVGGTVAEVSSSPDGHLRTTHESDLEFATRRATVRVPYEQVNLLEYGQSASRRYAMAILVSPVLLLSKARRHFLTIGYTTPDGRQHAMVFRVDKGDIRALLASLEARTGRKVQYQDDEARKGGRG